MYGPASCGGLRMVEWPVEPQIRLTIRQDGLKTKRSMETEGGCWGLVAGNPLEQLSFWLSPRIERKARLLSARREEDHLRSESLAGTPP